MVGMGCSFDCLSLRLATLLFILLVTLILAVHNHLTRVRTLDETTSLGSNSKFEDYVEDPGERTSDMEAEEGESALELINHLTINLVEEANALGHEVDGEAAEQFLEQLQYFRWFECSPAKPTLYFICISHDTGEVGQLWKPFYMNLAGRLP